MGTRIRLSVNVNKFALLRNARGHNVPNVVDIALKCLDYGADGVTVHPRPDGRHIRYDDVRALKKSMPQDQELNTEGYPSNDFMALVREVNPAQVTLVPDPPEALTSSFGWNVAKSEKILTPMVRQLQDAGIRVSIFIDPVACDIDALRRVAPDRIELFTYAYAQAFETGQQAFDGCSDHHTQRAITPYQACAEQAGSCGIGLNAGHDLNLHNIAFLAQNLEGLKEVSIGHALVCEAIDMGLHKVIESYRQALSI